MTKTPLAWSVRTLAAVALVATAGAAQATAVVGQPAPAFSAVDTAGKPVALADFKGRTVVLEWANPGCPFVKKHYDSANMQGTQKAAAAQGVVWLAVNSTNPSARDHLPAAEMAQWMRQQQAAATATLMDEDGRVGRAYGARTTPQMFVIDGRGTVVYAGAIDDKPSSNPADVKGATNHVKAALADLGAGRPVAVSSTRPYGCSVKY